VILFGGWDGGSTLDDTWIWDGNDWTKYTGQGPGARRYASLVSDGTDVLLFGGETSQTLADSWIFDGQTWVSVPASVNPPSRRGHAAEYHPAYKNALVHGGWTNSTTGLLPDFWAFGMQKRTWRQISARTLRVPTNYAKIQQAIDASSLLDQVLVAPGVYNENLDFKGKDVVVTSSHGARLTTIHGGGKGSTVTFSSGESRAAALDGFTVTGGTGTLGGGGGIACTHGSSPTIRGNVVTGNTCQGLGAYGGGIHVGADCDPIIIGNVICHNTAESIGGGISCDRSCPLIVNNVIHHNQATTGGGGGIFCVKCANPVQIVNNTIYSNTSASGGGIGTYNAMVDIANTILWGNSAPATFGPEIWVGSWLAGSTVTISNSDVKGGKSAVAVHAYCPGCVLNWGAGMIDANPAFVDPANDDVHLTYGSPCRETGSSAASGIPLIDFEGDPRSAGLSADMGADEFYAHLYYTGRATPGQSIDIKVIGSPSSPLLWAFSLYPVPLTTPAYIPGVGDLYLSPPFLFGLNVAIPTSGVFSWSLQFPPSFPAPSDFPTQALIGLELTNLDVICVR
jgi:parallel beta helix pectate lyase-like protein/galactose oxidase-like protein